MKGEEAELRGKGSGRGGAALGPRPPLSSSPAPAPALPRTCAGLPPSPGGSRRAALGDQRTRRSRAQGEGAGNFPPRLPGPAPLPLPRQVWGGSAGGIPPRCDGSGEPGLGGGRGVVREKSGKREGTGWDQARSCLLQTPAASACPGLSVHHSRLFRGCGGREWHFHGQARGVRICEGKSVRIGKRVYACAFENEWLTGSVCVHFIQGCL